MTAKETVNMRIFPVVVDTGCKNIANIYPLKQSEVARIYDAMNGFDVVRRVYIFGSATTGRCHINSDLDICIDADISDGMKIYDLQKTIGDICNWNCDIVMYENMGGGLRDTIDREGVVIYEHNDDFMAVKADVENAIDLYERLKTSILESLEESSEEE